MIINTHMNIKFNIDNKEYTIYGIISKNQPLPYLSLEIEIIFNDKTYYPYERPHILLLKRIRDNILTRNECVICFLNLKELFIYYYDNKEDCLYFIKQYDENDYFVKALSYEDLMIFISDISQYI